MSIHESEFEPHRLFSRVPPAKKIAETFGVDLSVARRVRRILRGELDPRTVPETDSWCRQCYHEPKARDQAEHAANVLLDAHGVEAVQDPRSCTEFLFHYLNTGDTYSATLVFTGEWPRARTAMISTWGDCVESIERRGIRFR